MADVDTTNWIPGTKFYTQISDTNHAGWLYIITLLSLCYIVIVFAVRFVVKYGMYGQDDWTLLASTILAAGQHIALLAGLGEGLGKSSTLLSSAQLDDLEKYTSAHIFLFVLSHSLSKTSSALLTQRLFQNGRTRNIYLCWGLVGASIFYGLWAVLSLAIQCPNPAFPMNTAADQCANRYLRLQLITAIDIATEAILVLVSCCLLIDVQIKSQAKLLVMAVFAVRLPDIIFSAVTLCSFHKSLQETDTGLALVYPIIWTQTELLWSIVAATVPCLKTFMRPFDQVDEDTWRSNNDMYASQRDNGARSWRDPRDGAVPLEDIKGHKHGLIYTSNGSDQSVQVRPDGVSHNVTIAHGMDSGHRRSRSWGSQERIIHAQTTYEVRHEGGRDPYEIP